MVPGDIGAELAKVLRAAAAAGELPAAAAALPAAGTWRPAPPGEGSGPGTYATSLPILLARGTGRDARSLAAWLAAALDPVPWIAAARGTGPGYLTVTVTTPHLAALPARIAAGFPRAEPFAPPIAVPIAPPLPDPAAAPDWPAAWHAQRDALALRLAGAAGPDNPDFAPQHHDIGNRRLALDSSTGPGPAGGAVAGGAVAAAVAWYGADAVRYALARTAGPRPAAIERQLGLPLDLDNPFVLVRYARAHAASTARWAADHARAAGSAGRAGRPEPRSWPGPGSGGRAGRPEPSSWPGPGAGSPEPQPEELALLGSLSWSAERLGAAARRRRPAELCAYLEQVAAAYLHCARQCPALPSGGAAAPDPASPLAAARLELAAAAGAVLAGGLRLAGVSSPDEQFDI